jgi:general stress protein 26
MKKEIQKIIFCILLVMIFNSSSLFAQAEYFQQKQKIPRDSILKVARIIIDSAKCRVLVTVDENGKPHAREMAPFPPEDNWVIWLGTSTKSRKVKQIQKNPNVVVFYYDTYASGYASVSGQARLVNDPELKAKYWVKGWDAFYPDRDKEYTLIEVTPEVLEVCSFRYRFFWDPETGIPPLVEF